MAYVDTTYVYVHVLSTYIYYFNNLIYIYTDPPALSSLLNQGLTLLRYGMYCCIFTTVSVYKLYMCTT